MATKRFALGADQMKPLAEGRGSALATDRITVEGLPVRYMYREAPDGDVDSGWRFFSGEETEEELEDPERFGLYDVNTVANYDPSILPLLDAPAGSAFEKLPGADGFEAVEPPEPE